MLKSNAVLRRRSEDTWQFISVVEPLVNLRSQTVVDTDPIIHFLRPLIHTDVEYLEACIYADLTERNWLLVPYDQLNEPRSGNLLFHSVEKDAHELTKFLLVECSMQNSHLEYPFYTTMLRLSRQRKEDEFHRRRAASLNQSAVIVQSKKYEENAKLLLEYSELSMEEMSDAEFNFLEYSDSEILLLIDSNNLPLLQRLVDVFGVDPCVYFTERNTRFSSFEFALINNCHIDIVRFLDERMHRTKGRRLLFTDNGYSWLFLHSFCYDVSDLINFSKVIKYLLFSCGTDLLLIKDSMNNSFLHNICQMVSYPLSIFRIFSENDLLEETNHAFLTQIIDWFQEVFDEHPEVDIPSFWVNNLGETPLSIACALNYSSIALMLMQRKKEWRMDPFVARKQLRSDYDPAIENQLEEYIHWWISQENQKTDFSKEPLLKCRKML